LKSGDLAFQLSLTAVVNAAPTAFVVDDDTKIKAALR
jgi:hypothetical protein